MYTLLLLLMGRCHRLSLGRCGRLKWLLLRWRVFEAKWRGRIGLLRALWAEWLAVSCRLCLENTRPLKAEAVTSARGLLALRACKRAIL